MVSQLVCNCELMSAHHHQDLWSQFQAGHCRRPVVWSHKDQLELLVFPQLRKAGSTYCLKFKHLFASLAFCPLLNYPLLLMFLHRPPNIISCLSYVMAYGSKISELPVVYYIASVAYAGGGWEHPAQLRSVRWQAQPHGKKRERLKELLSTS